MATQQELRNVGQSSANIQRTQQVQARALEQYKERYKGQQEMIRQEIEEREKELERLNIRKEGDFGKRVKAETIKEIALLKGELEVYREAQSKTARGQLVQVSDAIASAYAKTTPDYQRASYSLKKVIARQKGESEVTKELSKKYNVDFLKAQKIKKELREIPEKTYTVYNVSDIEKTEYIKTADIKPQKLQGEIYSDQLGMFIAPSPTGYGATGYQRIPTPAEQVKIDLASQQGSLAGVIDIAERKIVTPVMESKPVQFAMKPFKIKFLPVQDTSSKWKLISLGEAVYDVREGFRYAGEKAMEQWSEVSQKAFQRAESSEGKKKTAYSLLGYATMGAGYGARASPTIAQYSLLGGIGGSAMDLTALEHEKTLVPELTEKELSTQYSLYQKEYAKAEKDLKEGYTLEPKLSKTEFDKKYKEQVSSSVLTGIRREQVIPFFIFAGSVASKTIRYLKQPEARVVKIKAPRSSLRTKETIGEDINIAGQKGVYFRGQRLIQLSKAGRRTEVISKWKGILNRNLGTNFEPFYRGVPYQQPQRYIETVEWFKDYGYSEKAARSILRYEAPVVRTMELREGYVWLSEGGKKATKEFVFLTKQPTIVIDKKLGIKTRGAKTIKTLVNIKQEITDKGYLISEKTTVSLPVDKSGRFIYKTEYGISYPKIKDISYSISKSKGIVTKGKAYIKFGSNKDMKIYESFLTEDIKTVSFSKQLIPKESAIRVDTGRTTILTGRDLSATKLKRVTQIKKTPFSKTFFKEEKIYFPDEIKATRSTGYESQKLVPLEESLQIQLKSVPVQDIGLKTYSRSLNRELLDTGFNLKFENLEQGALASIKMQSQIKTFDDIKSFNLQPTEIKSDILTIQKVSPKIQQQLVQQQEMNLELIQEPVFQKRSELPQQPDVFTSEIQKIESPIKTAMKKIAKMKPEKFGVFVRKAGKDISIGTFGTLGKAKKELTETLRTTLRASGYITKDQKKIKAKELGLFGASFRPSFKDPFRVVERKTKRLKKGSRETTEIIGFRRSKSKKRSKLFKI